MKIMKNGFKFSALHSFLASLLSVAIVTGTLPADPLPQPSGFALKLPVTSGQFSAEAFSSRPATLPKFPWSSAATRIGVLWAGSSRYARTSNDLPVRLGRSAVGAAVGSQSKFGAYEYRSGASAPGAMLAVRRATGGGFDKNLEQLTVHGDDYRKLKFEASGLGWAVHFGSGHSEADCDASMRLLVQAYENGTDALPVVEVRRDAEGITLVLEGSANQLWHNMPFPGTGLSIIVETPAELQSRRTDAANLHASVISHHMTAADNRQISYPSLTTDEAYQLFGSAQEISASHMPSDGDLLIEWAADGRSVWIEEIRAAAGFEYSHSSAIIHDRARILATAEDLRQLRHTSAEQASLETRKSSDGPTVAAAIAFGATILSMSINSLVPTHIGELVSALIISVTVLFGLIMATISVEAVGPSAARDVRVFLEWSTRAPRRWLIRQLGGEPLPMASKPLKHVSWVHVLLLEELMVFMWILDFKTGVAGHPVFIAGILGTLFALPAHMKLIAGIGRQGVWTEAAEAIGNWIDWEGGPHDDRRFGYVGTILRAATVMGIPAIPLWALTLSNPLLTPVGVLAMLCSVGALMYVAFVVIPLVGFGLFVVLRYAARGLEIAFHAARHFIKTHPPVTAMALTLLNAIYAYLALHSAKTLGTWGIALIDIEAFPLFFYLSKLVNEDKTAVNPTASWPTLRALNRVLLNAALFMGPLIALRPALADGFYPVIAFFLVLFLAITGFGAYTGLRRLPAAVRSDQDLRAWGGRLARRAAALWEGLEPVRRMMRNFHASHERLSEALAGAALIAWGFVPYHIYEVLYYQRHWSWNSIGPVTAVFVVIPMMIGVLLLLGALMGDKAHIDRQTARREEKFRRWWASAIGLFYRVSRPLRRNNPLETLPLEGEIPASRHLAKAA